jgi:hypothetical protein
MAAHGDDRLMVAALRDVRAMAAHGDDRLQAAAADGRQALSIFTVSYRI